MVGVRYTRNMKNEHFNQDCSIRSAPGASRFSLFLFLIWPGLWPVGFSFAHVTAGSAGVLTCTRMGMDLERLYIASFLLHPFS